MHKAMFAAEQNGSVRCDLCAHHCVIGKGKRGICRVRENRDGQLYTLVYGKLVAEHVDPIEKKPLFHVLPGSTSYSISTRGCNFRCLHCQNASISQVDKGEDPARFCSEQSPEQVVNHALKNGCSTISYTYVEPTVFFEFAYDCSRLAVDRGIKNVFVSNGYMSEGATRALAPFLHAINIDIKSFSGDFYKKVCGARLQPVLDSVQIFYELGVWVEVTTLLIPGVNDSPEELLQIAEFLADLDKNIPWHVTAFYPTHKMTEPPPTSASILDRARVIGSSTGLNYVYSGNIPGSGGENTLCPGCGKTVIERHGFSILQNRLKNGVCPDCATRVPGVW